MNSTLNCNGKLVSLSSPVVMGILNITPDSFYDGGKFFSEDKIIEHTRKMIAEGATIIDVGGQSTRPRAEMISQDEEIRRVIPVIELLKKNFPDTTISIDTFRSRVAEEAVKADASIVNDISGGSMDKEMFSVVGKLNVPYILTHIKGNPENMQENPQYENVVREVKDYFKEKIFELRNEGVKDIILDPGFGFGKTVEHNYSLLKHLNSFFIFELPLLAGISRKSMINRVLKTSPETALNGTTALNTIALMNGATILRVHDVKEANETIALFNQYYAAV